MSNVLVMMSGGTTTVINATLAGAIKEAQERGMRVFVGKHGLVGVICDGLEGLPELSDYELLRLAATPGSSFIGTSRTSMTTAAHGVIFDDICEKHGIDVVINIGGSGTIKQSKVLSRYSNRRFVALPKTVDNDLGDQEFEKLVFTPGFPSCVNYWCDCVQMLNNENIGSYQHDNVLIAQTFGRETGFIAGAARFADRERELPLVLLLPEDQQAPGAVIEKIGDLIISQGRAIVIMSEGYDVGSLGARYDLSGQVLYGSSKTTAVSKLVNLCCDEGIQAREFNPTVQQRQDVRSRSSVDMAAAYMVGQRGVEWAISAGEDFFVGIGPHLSPVKIPLSDIDEFNRVMRPEWIERDGYDVTDSYVKYLEQFCQWEPSAYLQMDGV